MAKAVFTTGVQFDPRLMAEVVSLRARVAELEHEISAMRLEQASFDDEVLSLSPEPAVLA